MTHLLDSSAALANVFGEPGMERVRTLVKDPGAVVGVSVLTLYETYTTVVHRDPHFATLPTGRPLQEILPDKTSG